jgi:hypothetical protein
VIEVEADGIGILRNGVVGRMTPEQIEEAAEDLFEAEKTGRRSGF